METTKKYRWVTEDTWISTLASLLPLWLLSLAITAEGFPDPPIAPELGSTAFVLAIVVSIVLLWKWWLPFDVLLISFIPFLLLFKFDEISTSYKTPFILLCALTLSIGIVGAQSCSSVKVRWLILYLSRLRFWCCLQMLSKIIGKWSTVWAFLLNACQIPKIALYLAI